MFVLVFEKELAFYNQHQHLFVLRVLPNRLELSKLIIELTWILYYLNVALTICGATFNTVVILTSR